MNRKPIVAMPYTNAVMARVGNPESIESFAAGAAGDMRRRGHAAPARERGSLRVRSPGNWAWTRWSRNEIVDVMAALKLFPG
jgi:hypothetical protein